LGKKGPNFLGRFAPDVGVFLFSFSEGRGAKSSLSVSPSKRFGVWTGWTVSRELKSFTFIFPKRLKFYFSKTQKVEVTSGDFKTKDFGIRPSEYQEQ